MCVVVACVWVWCVSDGGECVVCVWCVGVGNELCVVG